MNSKRQRSRIHFESLESRSLMASDYNAIVTVETLNLQNQPVSRVEIGQAFKLRLSLENPSDRSTIDLGVSGYVGITFDPTLAEKTGDFQFSSVYSLGQNYDIKGPGKWEDLGAVPDLWNPEMDSPPKRRTMMEVEMKAIAGGEVIFESNPSDSYANLRGIFAGYPNVVEFGYARLQIGDPNTYPSSPWRSPQDPSDVDGDGTVTEDDLYLLETILGMREPEVPYQPPHPREGVPPPESPITPEIRALMDIGAQGSIQLEGSQVPTHRAPYLDVNGDRVADMKDVLALKEEFQLLLDSDNQTNPPLAFLMDPEFELEVRVVNLRTQSVLAPNSQVRVGDLIQIEWLNESRGLEHLFSWLPDLHFEFMEDRPNLLLVTGTGNFELKLRPRLNELVRTALVAGVTPEALAPRLHELANPLARQVTSRPNNNRPTANNHSYPFSQFIGLESAREAVELLTQPNVRDLRIEANQGLLAGTNSNQSLRILVVSHPISGKLTLNDDGSFVYSLYDHSFQQSLFDALKSGDQFSYVLISPDGVSEIRTARIEPVILPLLDLHLKTVDVDGNPISSATVGQEFYLELSSFGNNRYRTAPRQFKPGHPLQFEYHFDSQVAQSAAPPQTPDIFNWERYYLGEEDGKLVVKSELMRPEFTTQDAETQASFLRFSLILPETTIFRQKLVATQPGPLLLQLDDILLNNDVSNPQAFHIQVDSLVVVSQESTTLSHIDVSGNGQINPLDALIVINRLNASRKPSDLLASASADSHDPCDVNRDGSITPFDALLVINWLNANGSTSTLGEGEANVSSHSSAVDEVFAMPWNLDPLDSDSRQRKSRLR